MLRALVSFLFLDALIVCLKVAGLRQVEIRPRNRVTGISDRHFSPICALS